MVRFVTPIRNGPSALYRTGQQLSDEAEHFPLETTDGVPETYSPEKSARLRSNDVETRPSPTWFKIT